LSSTSVGTSAITAICATPNKLCFACNGNGTLVVWNDDKLLGTVELEQPITRFHLCEAGCIIGMCPFGLVVFRLPGNGTLTGPGAVWKVLGCVNGVLSVDPRSTLARIVFLDKQGLLTVWDGDNTLRAQSISPLPLVDGLFWPTNGVTMIQQTGAVIVHRFKEEAASDLVRACVVVQSRRRTLVLRRLLKAKPWTLSVVPVTFACASKLMWINASVVAAANVILDQAPDDKVSPELVYLQVCFCV
jgi:hypothetical protein